MYKELAPALCLTVTAVYSTLCAVIAVLAFSTGTPQYISTLERQYMSYNGLAGMKNVGINEIAA